MSNPVCDNFYFSQSSVFHRISSCGYSESREYVRTFCGCEFDISGDSELISVPIRLLDRTEVCVECERNYSHIQHNRFNFDEDGDYKFFMDFDIKTGGKRGERIRETVETDSLEDAKDMIVSKYDMAEIYNFNYISRSEKYGEWDVLVNEIDF